MVTLLMSKDTVLNSQAAMLFNAVASFTAGVYTSINLRWVFVMLGKT